MMAVSTLSAALAVLRLTPRDRMLVQVLHELRYLTAAQIRQVCYPTISIASTSHRLSLLRSRGLFDCLTHRAFSDRRAFWTLTPLGRAAGGAAADAPPPPPRAFAVAAVQMEHLIATNQIFCDLCRISRAGRLGPFRWYGSQHARVDLGSTHLVPDAVILLPSPEGRWWMYSLELDRHTMSADALVEKFERYRLMYRLASLRREESPLWEARADSWVLFACGGVDRAAEGVRLAAAQGLDRIWAGAAADLPEALAAAVGGVSGAPACPPAAAPGGLPGGIMPLEEGRS